MESNSSRKELYFKVISDLNEKLRLPNNLFFDLVNEFDQFEADRKFSGFDSEFAPGQLQKIEEYLNNEFQREDLYISTVKSFYEENGITQEGQKEIMQTIISSYLLFAESEKLTGLGIDMKPKQMEDLARRLQEKLPPANKTPDLLSLPNQENVTLIEPISFKSKEEIKDQDESQISKGNQHQKDQVSMAEVIPSQVDDPLTKLVSSESKSKEGSKDQGRSQLPEGNQQQQHQLSTSGISQVEDTSSIKSLSSESKSKEESKDQARSQLPEGNQQQQHQLSTSGISQVEDTSSIKSLSSESKSKEESKDQGRSQLPEGNQQQQHQLSTSGISQVEGTSINDRNRAEESKRSHEIFDSQTEHGKTAQLLKEQYINCEEMPQCFEKHLLSLHYYTTLKSLNLAPNWCTDEEISKLFEDLKGSAKNEDRKSEDISRLLDLVKTEFARKDWRTVSETLRIILSKIRVFDIKYTMDLFKKTEDAAQSVKDKEVFLLLGNTGVGKSTLIQFLAGSRMGVQQIGGFSHIGPIEVAENPDLRNVIAAPYTKSETRYITPVNIKYRNQNIIVCDSPGFEDTNGPEVDIANCIGIIKAIKGCQSVRPIILLSSKGGDRFQALKKNAHILVGMIKDINRYLSSFSYLFTKFSSQELQNIPAVIGNIIDNFKPEEQTDKTFVEFIYDMKEKVKKQPRLSVELLQDDPNQILTELMRVKAIQNPDDVFRVSLPPLSLGAVIDQCQKHQIAVISAAKRGDFALAKWKLDELKELNGVLGQDSIKNIYQECVNFLLKVVNQNYNDAVSYFAQRLTSKHAFNSTDIQRYKDYIEKAENAESLRVSHLGSEAVSLAAYENKISVEIESQCTEFASLTLGETLAIKEIADKVQLLANAFPAGKYNYDDLRKKIADLVNSSFVNFERATKEADFQESGRELHNLSLVQQSLSNHLSIHLLQSYEKAHGILIEKINIASSKFDAILEDEFIIEADYADMAASVQILTSCKEAYALHPYIPLIFINEKYDKLVKKLEKMAYNRILKIQQLLSENPKSRFDVFEPQVSQIGLLFKNIEIIAVRTSKSFNDLMNKMIDSVKGIKLDIERTLLRSFESGVTNYQELNANLVRLDSAKWIETYHEGLFESIFEDVKDQLCRYLTTVTTDIQEANLDQLENHNLMISSMKKVTDAANMRALIGIPEIEEKVKKLVQEFSNSVERAFTQIIEDFHFKEDWNIQKDRLNFRKIKTTIQYIQATRSVDSRILLCSSIRTRAEDIFTSYLTSYSKLLMAGVDDTFRQLNNYDPKKYDKNEISLLVSTLVDLLRTVTELFREHKDIIQSQYFPDSWRLMDTFKREILSYQSDLRSKLTDSVTYQSVSTPVWLNIARSLGKLDEFNEMGIEKFSEIHKTFCEMDQNRTDQTLTKLLTDINTHKYQDARIEMEKLQQRNDNVSNHNYQKAKQQFNTSLIDLTDHLTNHMHTFSLQLKEDIMHLKANLTTIERAQMLMKPHMTDPNTLEESVSKIKSTLSEKVQEFLDDTNVLLRGNRFLEVEANEKSVKVIKNLFSSYLDANVSSQIDLFESQKKDHVENVQKYFSELPLDDYLRSSPAAFLRALEESSGKNLRLYAKTRGELTSAIKDKIDNRLEDLRNSNVTINRDTFIRLENILSQLPPELRVSTELERLRSDFENQQNRHGVQFQDAKKNLKELKRLYSETIQTNSRTIAIEIKDFVIREVKNHVGALKIHVNDLSKIEESLQTWKLISLDFNSNFGGEFNEVHDAHESAKEIFTNFIETLIASVVSPFIKLDLCTIPDETIQSIHIRFENISKLMSLRNKNSELLPNDFESRYLGMCQTIAETFDSIMSRFEEGLNNLDVSQMQSALTTIAKWINFNQRIKSSLALDFQLVNAAGLVKNLPDNNSYTEMIRKISKKFQSLKEDFIRNISPSLITDSLNFLKSEVDEKYKKLRETFSMIERSTQFNLPDAAFKPDEPKKACQDFLELKIEALNLTAQSLLKEVLRDSSERKSREFMVSFRHLVSISENLDGIFRTPLEFESIKNEIHNKVRELISDCKTSLKDPQKVSKILKKLKMISQQTEILKDEIDSQIDDLLKDYKEANNNDSGFAILGTVLNSDRDGIGALIIAEHNILEGFANAIFYDRTHRHGIDHVLQHLEGNSLNKELLMKRYTRYEKCYSKLREEHLKPGFSTTLLLSDIQLLVSDVTAQVHDKINWDISGNLPELIAHVSLLYTLLNAGNYFEAHDKEKCLKKPHAAQIISIFRMLGVGDDDEKLANNIVQVGTGEGKSLIIAITASVLALCGFEVSCVCYSDYLSTRDFKAFNNMFQCLNITEYIHYGTFSKCCEDMINREGEIREIVNELISSEKFSLNKKEKKQRAEILIIDEVDVFFQKEFYGNLYTPSARLCDPTIKILADYIWKHRSSNLRFATVKASTEYQNCFERYPQWGFLIEEAVKDMLADLKTFESHDYIISKDKIAYKDHSGVSSNVTYGYKTLWAYYKENENKKISKEGLEKNIRINIKCGSFSYAHIPEQFSFTMGVSGTLKTLSEPEKDIVQNVYNIHKKTFLPSVFGLSNLDPVHYYIIVKTPDYFNRIATEITNALRNNKRAVLVFFENEKVLKDFYGSKACSTLPSTPKILPEEAEPGEKDIFVSSSTTQGKISLLTRIFGRGTDFVCRDQTIIENGGIHVIQTFLSEELSEETQIKGRTARQGYQGSYGMILQESDLEKFLIMPSDIQEFNNSNGAMKRFMRFILQIPKPTVTIYDILNERRNIYFKTQFESNGEFVEFARKEHKLAMSFRENLFDQNIQGIQEFLKVQNKGADQEIIKTRTLVLMDATKSMDTSLQKAKNKVGQMFERAAIILKDHGIPQDCFEIQFAAYRNYNCTCEDILEYSPWESRPESLRLFLDKVETKGGWGREAIEIGFWYANQEAKAGSANLLKQIILIGDQAANKKEEVFEKRKKLGESYWQNSKFGSPTHYTTELAKLTQMEIPVHAFYIDVDAKENFEEIAASKKAKCGFLDIESDKGADMLAEVMTARILQEAGDAVGVGIGERLVNAFHERFEQLEAVRNDNRLLQEKYEKILEQLKNTRRSGDIEQDLFSTGLKIMEKMGNQITPESSRSYYNCPECNKRIHVLKGAPYGGACIDCLNSKNFTERALSVISGVLKSWR